LYVPEILKEFAVSDLLATPTSGSDRPDDRPRLLWKLLCIAYLIALAWLLLSTVPVRIARVAVVDHEWVRTVMSVGHFACFFLLALLVSVSRWGVPRWTIVLGLVACAAGAESLQSQFSGRLAETADSVQNLLGVGCGCVLCWWVALVRGSGR